MRGLQAQIEVLKLFVGQRGEPYEPALTPLLVALEKTFSAYPGHAGTMRRNPKAPNSSTFNVLIKASARLFLRAAMIQRRSGLLQNSAKGQFRREDREYPLGRGFSGRCRIVLNRNQLFLGELVTIVARIGANATGRLIRALGKQVKTLRLSMPRSRSIGSASATIAAIASTSSAFHGSSRLIFLPAVVGELERPMDDEMETCQLLGLEENHQPSRGILGDKIAATIEPEAAFTSYCCGPRDARRLARVRGSDPAGCFHRAFAIVSIETIDPSPSPIPPPPLRFPIGPFEPLDMAQKQRDRAPDAARPSRARVKASSGAIGT